MPSKLYGESAEAKKRHSRVVTPAGAGRHARALRKPDGPCPLTGKLIDYSKHPEAQFRRNLHRELVKLRKLPLRLGRLASASNWIIKQEKLKSLLARQISVDALREEDVAYEIRQKGVDLRIGIDIASLAFKRQRKRIILIAGDSDFVPAAKLARREGIDFILDPMWGSLPEDLNEHVDGVRSTCPRSASAPASSA